MLTISSPDSFQTSLRQFISHFVCTSLDALDTSVPAFHSHASSLVQRNPVFQAAHKESSWRRQSFQDLNHKQQAENKGLHKATDTAVIVQSTFSLRGSFYTLGSFSPYTKVIKINLKPFSIALPSISTTEDSEAVSPALVCFQAGNLHIICELNVW